MFLPRRFQNSTFGQHLIFWARGSPPLRIPSPKVHAYDVFCESFKNQFLSCLFCLVLYVSNNLYFLFRSKGKRLPIDKAEIVPAVQFSSKASSLPKSPPPPPKQPPPPPQFKRPSSSGSVPSKPPSVPGRAGLLSQIQKGTKLKRAATNDRSAPRV